MSFASKISVNTHYTRSINLERDASSVEVVGAYIPTSRAIRTFERVAQTFDRKDGPRAWSLIGPYGSGKSSFSVFLSQLLAGENFEAGSVAREVLRKDNSQLSKLYSSEVEQSAGYLKVLITGSPEPLAKRLVQALADSAKAFWGGRRGKNSAIVLELQEAAQQEQTNTSEIIRLIGKLQRELSKAKGNSCNGIVIVIDELGKFLEYEARHYGANDVYLLQALAEHAVKGGEVNLLLFVLLHQSFEQYAKGLGENLKKEWSKVQGRFEEVPFLESAEQVLRVVSAAFEQSLSDSELIEIQKDTAKAVAILAEAKALPGALSKEEAIALFSRCYPLHPVSAILLPLLCQKVAQNERTLFSYLGSHEEYGLQQMLSQMEKIGDWVLPHQVFDYFITNQPAALGDYMTHRRWAEVITALERLGDADSETTNLLKTIGVLNIIGGKGGFKASKAILRLCALSERSLNKSLSQLKEKSVVTFRKFNNEYRVWQGSDFDLEESLQEELAKLGNFDLVAELNKSNYLLPVVARKYTIQTGALRYFVPEFTDAATFSYRKKSSEPTILLFLAQGQDDVKVFQEVLEARSSASDLLALCLNGPQLYEATAEVKGLEQVEHQAQELHTDPVARREFEDRISAARQQQQSLLLDLLNNPATSTWYWQNESQSVVHRRDLQSLMSLALGDVYNKAPIIQNELINRDKPSSQAVAGRNKLLFAMLSHRQEVDLGIEKFPPEKAIYRALLREHGIHQDRELNDWVIKRPKQSSTLVPAWDQIEAFFDASEKTPHSFDKLYAMLKAPPYGVKEGVLPVLVVAAVLANENELALYENRQYIPHLTEELLERFSKRPAEFAVQRFKIQGIRASIFDQYRNALFTKSGGERVRSVIDIVKPIASFIGGLDQFTRKTKTSQISAEAKSVRDAFSLAKSPEQLVFTDLPRALGYSPEAIDKHGEQALSGFSKKLMDCLQELKYCLANLRINQQQLVATAFKVDESLELHELRGVLSGRYRGLEQFTVDTDGLKAFIKRLTKTDGDDAHWFENILMFLGQKPVDKWSDIDRSEAEIKLSEFARRMLDLETLRVHYDRSAKSMEGDFDVLLLKTLRQGAEPIDEVVAIDAKRHEAAQDIKKELGDILKTIKDSELQLAVVAELVEEFLQARNMPDTSKKQAESKPLKSLISEGS